jgi:hypothetical protein
MHSRALSALLLAADPQQPQPPAAPNPPRTVSGYLGSGN